MKDGKLTLETICGGAVQERINRALVKVVDNILDPNTATKKKRTITLKLSFLPKEDDREDVQVGADVTYALASEESVATQMFVSKDLDTKQITIAEYEKGQMKGQMSFDDLGFTLEPDAEVVEAKDVEFDEETGEILEFKKARVD